MLGKRIAKLRQDKKLTQEELAEALQITRSALSLYELDKREPDIRTLSKIADFFDVTIDYLFGRIDIPNPIEKITRSISDDPELLEFWSRLKQREDLQLLIKLTKDMSSAEIKKIIRVIKAMEDGCNE